VFFLLVERDGLYYLICLQLDSKVTGPEYAWASPLHELPPCLLILPIGKKLWIQPTDGEGEDGDLKAEKDHCTSLRRAKGGMM
jgi:hypothetical protein